MFTYTSKHEYPWEVSTCCGLTFLLQSVFTGDKLSYWFTQTKDNFCIKIEFNSQRTCLVHQYGCHFVLEDKYGSCEVTWKCFISLTKSLTCLLSEWLTYWLTFCTDWLTHSLTRALTVLAWLNDWLTGFDQTTNRLTDRPTGQLPDWSTDQPTNVRVHTDYLTNLQVSKCFILTTLKISCPVV